MSEREPKPSFEPEEEMPQGPVPELNKRAIKEVEAVLDTPREEWVEKQRVGGMEVFNNYRDQLPGGRTFEKDIRDEDSRTHNEIYASEHQPHMGKKGELTPRKFTELIRDTLIETGVDVEDLKKKNERVQEIERGIYKLRKSNLPEEEIKKEGEKQSKELSSVMADLHYDASPALLRLLKKGYAKGEFTHF